MEFCIVCMKDLIEIKSFNLSYMSENDYKKNN